MRRAVALFIILALATPFAAAFGARKASCCCAGAMMCALKAKASCAASCSMGAARDDHAAPLPHGASRQAMAPFALTMPAYAAAPLVKTIDLAKASRFAPPDPPPPRA